MKVLGIDASLTATGICLLDNSFFETKKLFSTTLSSDLKDMDRILFIEKCMIGEPAY